MRILLPILSLVLLLISFDNSAAQRRVTYQELLNSTEQPNIYVDYVSLPSAEGDHLFNVSFRMDYDLLPFIRTEQETDDENQFSSPARMTVEILRGHAGNRRQTIDPVSNSTWSDTAYAESYEKTRSRTDHLEGAVSFKLQPGDYHMLLNLNRGESARESRSSERNFTVKNDSSEKSAEFVLAESIDENGQESQIKLLNYGENILYGENYTLLVLLPEDIQTSRYVLTIERLVPGSDSDIVGAPVLSHTISADEVDYTSGFWRESGEKSPTISYSRTSQGYPIYVTEIPNRQFANAAFKISLQSENGEEPVLEKVVNSKWIDIPVSLLNLNVSINMLKFITDENQIRSINSGSTAEKEQKFRDFWSERDPTPDSEYNELMAEYYRRIDHAFDQFTTYEQAGYDSDQGKAYINFGPPLSKERRLPVNGPARELWVYRNQTLVFEATSGFGDFKLIGRE